MLIGFTGKAGSGKSTACQMVQDDLPDVIRVNFKDGLVAEMKKNFPKLLQQLTYNEYIIDEDRYDRQCYDIDDLFKYKPPMMRTLMQEYGTEVRRGDDPDYWIRQWKETVLTNQQFHIVCDDVRFLNEAKALKDLGGILVMIKRDDTMDTGTHQSEVEMDQMVPDFVFNAVAGDHDGLRTQIRELYTPELIPRN